VHLLGVEGHPAAPEEDQRCLGLGHPGQLVFVERLVTHHQPPVHVGERRRLQAGAGDRGRRRGGPAPHRRPPALLPPRRQQHPHPGGLGRLRLLVEEPHQLGERELHRRRSQGVEARPHARGRCREPAAGEEERLHGHLSGQPGRHVALPHLLRLHLEAGIGDRRAPEHHQPRQLLGRRAAGVVERGGQRVGAWLGFLGWWLHPEPHRDVGERRPAGERPGPGRHAGRQLPEDGAVLGGARLHQRMVAAEGGQGVPGHARLGRAPARNQVAELHAGGAQAGGVVGEGRDHGERQLPGLGFGQQGAHHRWHGRGEGGEPTAGVGPGGRHPPGHPHALVLGEAGCHESGAGQLVTEAGGGGEPGERGAQRSPRHPRPAGERLGGTINRHGDGGHRDRGAPAGQRERHLLAGQRVVGPEHRRREGADRRLVEHTAAMAHHHQLVAPGRVQHPGEPTHRVRAP
jgi:hypothetical protein